MQYINYLHNHTDFSNIRLIDCIIKYDKLIDRAIELGAKAVAITDHESLSGHIKALKYVKDGKKEGKIPEDFRLILGNEIYLVDEIKTNESGGNYCDGYYHFILLAKDEIGHRQLRELSSKAWERSFRTGKMERVPTLKSDVEEIVKGNPGHLIASTACIGGELGKKILAGDMQGAYNFLMWCWDVFGDEDFYLEMQPNAGDEQMAVNKTIAAISENKIPTIITTDSHYLNKEDRAIHEAYLNSHEEEREVGEFYATCYMMPLEEIHEYLDEQIGREAVDYAIQNTIGIAEKVEEYDLYHDQMVPPVTIPSFEMEHSFANVYDKFPYIKKFAESDDDRDRYFLRLIEDGWWEKEYVEGMDVSEIQKMMARINEELEAVWETSEKIHDKVSGYYLSALEIEDMMWDDSEDGGCSIVGPGRGSVAAFYTAYLIGLQQINSLKKDIPSWRHLHASRPEMPDFVYQGRVNQQ